MLLRLWDDNNPTTTRGDLIGTWHVTPCGCDRSHFARVIGVIGIIGIKFIYADIQYDLTLLCSKEIFVERYR